VLTAGGVRSYIIQRYIERPLLFKCRKFDIRCFMLVTSVNANLQAYWYQDGYLRTSSKEFNVRNVSCKFTHLTNDAIQKKCDDYGRYENGNKVSV
jgi:tubulin--tyrosine ligase